MRPGGVLAFESLSSRGESRTCSGEFQRSDTIRDTICVFDPRGQPEVADSKARRDGRVAEGARLESVCRGNSTVGSNPTLSATPRCARRGGGSGVQAAGPRHRLGPFSSNPLACLRLDLPSSNPSLSESAVRLHRCVRPSLRSASGSYHIDLRCTAAHAPRARPRPTGRRVPAAGRRRTRAAPGARPAVTTTAR